MFPNFRLLVAATLASIVVLICGLGMFATFRVSHAPLLRPVVATASPQSLADTMASSPLAFAPAEPFHRRFEIGATGRSDAVAAFTRFLARRENVESPPAASPAAPEPGAIAAKEQPTAIEMPKDAPAAVTRPADMPAAKAAPIATDAAVASLPTATAPPPEAATPPAVAPAAAVEPAPAQPAEPTPVQAAAVPPTESEQQAVAVKPAAITVPDSVARESEPTSSQRRARTRRCQVTPETPRRNRIRHARDAADFPDRAAQSTMANGAAAAGKSATAQNCREQNRQRSDRDWRSPRRLAPISAGAGLTRAALAPTLCA